MDTQEKDTQIESAEDLAAEKDFQNVPTEDAIRDSIIKEYGFDPENDADKERIEKLVKNELGHKTKLSTAIGQKIKYRERATSSKPTPPASKPEKGLTQEDVSRQVNAALEQDRLNALEYPDNIKVAIKRVAEIGNISIREAQQDPYIASMIETWQRDTGADGAAVTRTNKSGGKAMTDTDPSIPPDVDMNTKEGRDAYDAWLKKQIEAGH